MSIPARRRAKGGISTAIKTGVGAIKESPGNLYWISLNVDDGGGYIILSDDTDGASADVYRMDRDYSDHVNLDPPIEFSTGIYLKTEGAIINAIFGYE